MAWTEYAKCHQNLIIFCLYIATSFFWALINVTHVHPISLGFMRFVNSDLWCRNWVRNLSFQGKGCSDCLGFPQSCLLRGAGFRGIFEWGGYLYGGEYGHEFFFVFLGRYENQNQTTLTLRKTRLEGSRLVMFNRTEYWCEVVTTPGYSSFCILLLCS